MLTTLSGIRAGKTTILIHACNVFQNKEPKMSRKLKNLPSSIVQLHTMSEKEMWKVRAQDVSSETFDRLRHKCTDCIIGFNTEKLKDYHLNGKHKPVRVVF